MKTDMDIETTLEAIIDEHSLARVLVALEDICHGKADHLRSNWQDASAARVWERAAGSLCSARTVADEGEI